MGLSLDATDRDKMLNWFSRTLMSGARRKAKNGAHDATTFYLIPLWSIHLILQCFVTANQHHMYLSIVNKKQHLNSYINARVLGLSY